MTDTMTQCKLKRGTETQTSWIPSKFAQKDRVLRLKDEEGWVVEEVGGTLSKDMIKAQEKRSRNKDNFRSTK